MTNLPRVALPWWFSWGAGCRSRPHPASHRRWESSASRPCAAASDVPWLPWWETYRRIGCTQLSKCHSILFCLPIPFISYFMCNLSASEASWMHGSGELHSYGYTQLILTDIFRQSIVTHNWFSRVFGASLRLHTTDTHIHF